MNGTVAGTLLRKFQSTNRSGRNRCADRRVKPKLSPACLPGIPDRNDPLRFGDRLTLSLGTLRLSRRRAARALPRNGRANAELVWPRLCNDIRRGNFGLRYAHSGFARRKEARPKGFGVEN
jgi:hypothetical protein